MIYFLYNMLHVYNSSFLSATHWHKWLMPTVCAVTAANLGRNNVPPNKKRGRKMLWLQRVICPHTTSFTALPHDALLWGTILPSPNLSSCTSKVTYPLPGSGVLTPILSLNSGLGKAVLTVKIGKATNSFICFILLERFYQDWKKSSQSTSSDFAANHIHITK